MKTRVRQLKNGNWLAECRVFPFLWLGIHRNGEEHIIGHGLRRTTHCECTTLHEAAGANERYIVNARNARHTRG